jgi:TonB family protein
MQMKRKMMIGWLAVAVPFCLSAEQRGPTDAKVTISDKDITVISFEELKYPFLEQPRPPESEGVVVVRAQLDGRGRVLNATAISGNESLIPDSLANVKKWLFQPNAVKAAVVIYNFRLAKGECKSESSFFTFQRPDIATITGCRPKSAKSSSSHDGSSAVDVKVRNRDIEVLEFEELNYPALAKQARISGVVVVEVKLDDKGEVTEATAISGHPVLIPDCLANIKKWRFRPNARQLAVVVYDFTFPCQGLLYNSEGQRQFVLESPNFATVTATPATVQTSR